MQRLDSLCGHPLTGEIDLSELNGSTRDEIEAVVECIGLFVHLKKKSGPKARQQRIDLLSTAREELNRAIAEEQHPK